MNEKKKLPQTGTVHLEGFSDAVFAVAITLLALDFTVPERISTQQWQGLNSALLNQWPVYLAYALSFLTLLIMWINHHNLFTLVKRTDHIFLLLNGLLLLLVTTIPFGTSLLAHYLQNADRRTAEVVYSGLSLLMAVTYNRMWAYASHNKRLLSPDASDHLLNSRQFGFGPPLYAAAFLLAFISAEVSLVLVMALAVFFALPSTVVSHFIRRSPRT